MSDQRKFAVFDIDGTLIRWQLYHAVTDNLVKRGVIDGQRFESIRGARMAWKKRAPGTSFRNYEIEVISAYEDALSKLTANELQESIEQVFEEYKDQVYTYTRDLIKDLKAKNYLIFAISGSQSEIVELMAQHYSFDDFIGTVYERSGQSFTGNKIVPSHDKKKALEQLVEKHNLNFTDSVVVGDSKSDAAMLELVEKPIAFNPDKDLYELAVKNSWKIVLERKNMVYELENDNGQYRLVKTNAG
jgi:HAD superfamily hydrolase (TIGR01490 family)